MLDLFARPATENRPRPRVRFTALQSLRWRRFMLKILCAAVATAAAIGISPAAAQNTFTGWITHVDRDKAAVVMDDGRAFLVSPDIGVDALIEGVRVKVTFKSTPHGRKIIGISPAAAPASKKKHGSV
jgi:hypothetical protein